MKVLVSGATGYLGRHVVDALADAGHLVRALVRDPARLGASRARCAEVVVGEATRPETLVGVADGCDVVYSAVGIRSASRRADFWAVDHRANLNVFEEARRAGVERAVFVSVLRADVLRGEGVAIAEAREQVADYVLAHFARGAVFRPTSYFNDMEALFALVERWGVGFVPGRGRLRLNPIHGADLATAITRSLDVRTAKARAIAIGGPEVLTAREIVELAFDVLGKRPRILPLPTALLRPARWLAGPLNPTAAAFVHALERILAQPDMVAPAFGTRRLRATFETLAGGR